jgi:transcriptional repressor NrdR
VAEIEAHEVGMAVLAPLRELDEVAYLRFASVYRAFDDLADFEAEIALLRAEHELGEHTALTTPYEKKQDT